MKTLVTQIKMQKDLYLSNMLAMMLMFLFGVIIEAVVLHVDGDTGMICMGSLLAVIGLIMVMFFFGGFHMTSTCNYALMMGQTRKSFVWSYMLSTLLTYVVSAVTWEILHQLEMLGIRIMNPNVQIDDAFGAFITWKMWLAVILLATSVGTLVGATIVKFGKAAFWVWWALMMLTFIGGPRLLVMISVMPRENAMVRMMMYLIGFIVEHVMLTVSIAVTVVTLVSVVATWLLLRKQQVNV
ncbi:MAG: hypothetical protein J6B28_02255 [Eubacterium sp.]|nr:hypothetical protein [Eubacterium sp.]